MNLKKCQFDSITPCQNKGDICLRTCEERAKYNKVVDEMIEKLKTLKLPLEDSNVPLPNNFVGCGEVSDEQEPFDDEEYDEDIEAYTTQLKRARQIGIGIGVKTICQVVYDIINDKSKNEKEKLQDICDVVKQPIK